VLPLRKVSHVSLFGHHFVSLPYIYLFMGYIIIYCYFPVSLVITIIIIIIIIITLFNEGKDMNYY